MRGETLSLPFVPHSPTSKAAAKKQGRKPEKVLRDRAAIFDCIRSRGLRGATDAEIQAHLEMGGNTQRPRRGELARMGLIVKSGERRQGSAVWIVSPMPPQGRNCG